MRYTVILLLLSACVSVPETQTGTYDADGSYIGPNSWGYAQGIASAAGGECTYPGYQQAMGPAYSSSYNCATPLLFYSRSPYYPYYPALTPVSVSAPAAQRWRPHPHPHPHGTGHTPTAAHKSSGRGGKRK